MKNAKALDDLEMYEVIKLAYPEKFPETKEDDWDEVMEFVEGDLGGFEEMAEIIGRIVMLAPIMESGLTGKKRHCLGDVKVRDGKVLMTSVVSREYEGE